MSEAPLSILIGALAILLLFSAFFSSSETGMMAINRYRLRHLVRKGNKAAKRTSVLLERPDRLIGVILIGNNFVNILASALATVIAVRLWGDSGIAIATLGLTFIVLIFGEVTPKTVAAMYPEKIAFPSSLILMPLLKVLYPMVWLVNGICSLLMRPFGIRPGQESEEQLTSEELRTLVNESGLRMTKKRRGMLLGILDLEHVRVDGIMVPRNEVYGIDLDDDLDEIIQDLRECRHTRMPVFRDDIDNIEGILHMRKIAYLLSQSKITKELILQQMEEPYYVPESTPLHTQLINFQKTKARTALVVDEYGDIVGLVTLEDILEEIVGDFTTDNHAHQQEFVTQGDGSYIIDGTASIRDINKALGWELPTEDARTINGLITEVMEAIPNASVCWYVSDYRFEILQVEDNRVKSVRMFLAKSAQLTED